MQCPRSADLIRYLSGETGGEETARLDAHLTACPTCADTIAGLRKTWAALDAWQPDAPEIDLAGRVLTALEAESAVPRHHPWNWPALTRVAASVVLAAGLGIGAGRLVSQARAPEREAAMADGSRNEIVQTLASAFAATDSATGLALQFEPASDQEGR